MITPSAGSKLYEETFESGMVMKSVGGRKVEDNMFDGNYVIASGHARPWRKQLNLMVVYLWFYNPFRFVIELFRPKGLMGIKPFGMQIVGAIGFAQTVRRTFGWALRLMFCKITRQKHPPFSTIAMRDPSGKRAAHALDGTPLAEGSVESGAPK